MTSARPTNAIVYQARNLVNGHRYIGFTTQGLPKRQNQHYKSANGQQPRYRFQHAMAKYGIENFVFGVPGEFGADEELAKAYECEAIAAYKPEYNLTYGGDGGTLSEETRRKISAATKGRKGTHTGKKFSEETRRRMSEAARGKPHLYARGVKRDPEVVQRIRLSQMGHPNYNTKPMSEETRRKISAKNKGRTSWAKGQKFSDEHRQNMSASAKRANEVKSPQRLAALAANARAASDSRKIPIVCLTDGRVFGSSVEAAKFYGLGCSSVRQVVYGKRRAVRGLVFARHEVGD